MAYTPETLHIVEQLRDRMESVADTHTRTLTQAWVRAWDALSPELDHALMELMAVERNGRIPRRVVSQSRRLREALDIASEHIQDLAATLNATVSSGLPDEIEHAARRHGDVIQSQLPAKHPTGSAAFDRVNPDALTAIATRTTEQVHKHSIPLTRDMERAMKSELLRGIAVGDNPRTTARRIMTRTEHTFNGGLDRALTIARTEMLDAYRSAKWTTDQANSDILAGWRWHANPSRRTCTACFAMDGSEHPLSQAGPDGHQNCRCDRETYTKTWKQLGYDIDEPAPLGVTSAQSWFDEQPEAIQREIMGPTRLGLFKSGQIGWDDLAVRQHNEGWRTSVVPRTVTSLQRRADAA